MQDTKWAGTKAVSSVPHVLSQKLDDKLLFILNMYFDNAIVPLLFYSKLMSLDVQYSVKLFYSSIVP